MVLAMMVLAIAVPSLASIDGASDWGEGCSGGRAPSF